ncbi:error-prone DNA polymerase [Alkalilimnicola ehrlichii]|uniref:error-prone DNA polymerase n=1 Tax=Alkalilimnicola ehrlichii TaxID=351052 RepID=UPI000E2F50B7|nr:error-prone DNA polymerase [Alkalilimnicola ehrlichii]RFA29049.1 error-prone DNA polymerase [Alkalilimnicola ehrlichii]
MTSAPPYAELHCVSNFTFLRGASHPEELVARAAELGYRALAITDECSLAGVVRAHQAAKSHKLPLIIGSEFQLNTHLQLVLLAPHRHAYAQLSALISLARTAGRKGSYRLEPGDVENAAPDCLALLVGKPRPRDLVWFRRHFQGRGWLGVSILYEAGEDLRHHRLYRAGKRLGLPVAACGAVHMHRRGRRALQDTLTAIRLSKPLAELGKRLFPNGERHLRTRAQLARLYPPELLEETLAIAERCRFSLDELRYEYPAELVPAPYSPAQHLRALTEQGMRRRWPHGAPETVKAQIEHELALIGELAYEPYFLTVHDIVRFARSRGILCQGRGSAANSTVCFCLGITEVDPSRLNLLFERFVSRERDEPPDIDVDFEHERREEVIQYIYRKYGRHRAALAATVISYRPRSALRDVGKALGLDAHRIDRLAKSMQWWDGKSINPERLREAGFEPNDNPLLERLLVLSNELLGFPRHLSQHVGGFVISAGPLNELVPIENTAMEGRTVIQWDKDDLESLGLLKVDCLALGMLTAIHKAFDLIAEQHEKQLTLANVPAEDPAVYQMIQRADTIGVFQIESRAQMAMLPRMKPRCFYDLVIEVSLVRPGPIQGDMVHPYLRRREGLEPVTYPSEAVRGVLERTLGVPIFQEQVMQLAVVAAGFTPDEADRLRRAMGAWRRRGSLGPFERRLREGMSARGYNEQFASQIFRQIQGFGEYGFPESHAASFSLLVYVSAWLKCYEPAAFCCALLNSQPMGFYAPAQLVRDAREHGVEVRPVDVTASDWDSTLEKNDDGPALRLGLRLIKGLSAAAAQRIAKARLKAAFNDLEDLAGRAQLDKRELTALAQAGALYRLSGHRRNALWSVLGREPAQPLLADSRIIETPPKLSAPREGEDIRDDYHSLGLSLGRHPLALLRPWLQQQRLRSASELQSSGHRQLVRTAGIVINRQRPGSASGVTFVTLEDETGQINVVVWQDLAERQRKILLSARLLGVVGVWERKGEICHLIARRLEDYSALLGTLAPRSRDFH